MLLADDDPLLRRVLRRALTWSGALDVVGEAGDGARAVALAETLRPQLVVLDLRMPGLDGLEVTRRMRAAHPGCAILIYSSVETARGEAAALAAGADRYLEKSTGFWAVAEAAEAALTARRRAGGAG